LTLTAVLGSFVCGPGRIPVVDEPVGAQFDLNVPALRIIVSRSAMTISEIPA
jgi:hypothetical protein